MLPTKLLPWHNGKMNLQHLKIYVLHFELTSEVQAFSNGKSQYSIVSGTT